MDVGALIGKKGQRKGKGYKGGKGIYQAKGKGYNVRGMHKGKGKGKSKGYKGNRMKGGGKGQGCSCAAT